MEDRVKTIRHSVSACSRSSMTIAGTENYAYTLTVVGLVLGPADGDELGARLGFTVGAPVGGCEQKDEERKGP